MEGDSCQVQLQKLVILLKVVEKRLQTIVHLQDWMIEQAGVQQIQRKQLGVVLVAEELKAQLS